MPEQLNIMTKEELNYTISRFLCEVKKADGEDYPGSTLYELVIMLQLHLKQHDRNFRLLDEQKFVQLQNTLDNLMKARAAEGIGTHKRQAKVITETEEEILWDMGLLGVDDPKTLI